MFHRANPGVEWKVRCNRKISIPFQGIKLYPCIGLSYWFRWGCWVIDIRELAKYLQVPEKDTCPNITVTVQEEFEANMKPIIEAVGQRSFMIVIGDAYQHYLTTNNLPF